MKVTEQQLAQLSQSLLGLAGLAAFNPFVSVGVPLVMRGIIDLARRNQIDPGPFEERLAMAQAHIDQGLAADAAYRERHPDPSQ